MKGKGKPKQMKQETPMLNNMKEAMMGNMKKPSKKKKITGIQ